MCGPNWKWECVTYLLKKHDCELPEYLVIRAGFTDMNRVSNLGCWKVFDASITSISEMQVTGLLTFPQRGYFRWEGTIKEFKNQLNKSKGEAHRVLQDSRFSFYFNPLPLDSPSLD